MILSDATKKNWKKLHPETSQKLRRGANKTLSVKRVYPKEYITAKETYPFLERILAICDEDGISAEIAVYSLAVRMLENAGILHADHVKKTLHPYTFQVNKRIYDSVIPAGERDILGIVYQSLLSEGEKNVSGSYYTPFRVVFKMLEEIRLGDKIFLDPCCGSGAFLLALNPSNPEQLWGCDSDPAAVMIAQVNLLCKYADSIFVPHIYCCDFLTEPALPALELFQRKFDCIVTNPPWGAKGYGKRKNLHDSFSRFFIKACDWLVDGGKIVFLFPEAILNVKAHIKLREMLLTELRLNSIRFWNGNFTGVMTRYISVSAEKSSPPQTFLMEKGKTVLKKKICNILTQKDKIISFSGGEDDRILRAIANVKEYDLSSSVFAMGIVTGGNKEKLRQTPCPGMEQVYTGKEIDRYVLKNARNFILYDRDDFQQTAKDEYYRASEKLVYRFISKELVFACDDTRSLFLNSANILIPHLPGYSIKTVLAFLNSEPLRYYYMKTFPDIKILKNNLCQLPFPAITPEINKTIGGIIDKILREKNHDDALLQKIIFNCYRLSKKQISHIEHALRIQQTGTFS